MLRAHYNNACYVLGPTDDKHVNLLCCRVVCCVAGIPQHCTVSTNPCCFACYRVFMWGAKSGQEQLPPFPQPTHWGIRNPVLTLHKETCVVDFPNEAARQAAYPMVSMSSNPYNLRMTTAQSCSTILLCKSCAKVGCFAGVFTLKLNCHTTTSVMLRTILSGEN